MAEPLLESPLLRRIRESVIGDDQVMHGPVRPAPGHLRRLHRERPRADLHRGLHPRRGAAALRQHPHRVQRHRAADHPAARGRPAHHPRRGRRRRRHRRDLLRLGGDRGDRQARSASSTCASRPTSTTATACPTTSPRDERPVVFIGPFEHHSNELPWRESIADVVTIPEDRDGHIDLGVLEQQLVAPRRPAAEDRLLLGRVQRHRHRHRHAPRSPTCCTATARCRSGTSPPPRRTSTSR